MNLQVVPTKDLLSQLPASLMPYIEEGLGIEDRINLAHTNKKRSRILLYLCIERLVERHKTRMKSHCHAGSGSLLIDILAWKEISVNVERLSRRNKMSKECKVALKNIATAYVCHRGMLLEIVSIAEELRSYDILEALNGLLRVINSLEILMS